MVTTPELSSRSESEQSPHSIGPFRTQGCCCSCPVLLHPRESSSAALMSFAMLFLAFPVSFYQVVRRSATLGIPDYPSSVCSSANWDISGLSPPLSLTGLCERPQQTNQEAVDSIFPSWRSWFHWWSCCPVHSVSVHSVSRPQEKTNRLHCSAQQAWTLAPPKPTPCAPVAVDDEPLEVVQWQRSQQRLQRCCPLLDIRSDAGLLHLLCLSWSNLPAAHSASHKRRSTRLSHKFVYSHPRLEIIAVSKK